MTKHIGYFYQHHQIYDQLNLKVQTRLPDDGMDPKFITVHDNGFQLLTYVMDKVRADRLAKLRKRSFIQRVYCECPTCMRWIPTGRLHQHPHTVEHAKAHSAFQALQVKPVDVKMPMGPNGNTRID